MTREILPPLTPDGGALYENSCMLLCMKEKFRDCSGTYMGTYLGYACFL